MTDGKGLKLPALAVLFKRTFIFIGRDDFFCSGQERQYSLRQVHMGP